VDEGAHAVPTLGSVRLLDLTRHGSIVVTAPRFVKSKADLLSIPKVQNLHIERTLISPHRKLRSYGVVTSFQLFPFQKPASS
jgi:hypothetical protein